MKRSLLLLALLTGLTGAPLTAQSHQAHIRAAAEKYLQATEQSDWETVADMLYPKLFTIASREDIIASFQELNSDDIKVTIRDGAIKDIGEPAYYEDEQYAFVDYTMSMDMQFSDASLNDIMMAQFESMYGADNVRLDKATNTFLIQAANTMIAFSPKGGNEWTFLEYKPDMEAMFNQILGEAFVNQLKERE